MDCQGIIRELRTALKKNDEELREEIKRIVKKYSKRPSRKGDFEIRKGGTYLIDEKQPKHVRSIYLQVISRGYSGIYVSRSNPHELDFPEESVEKIWLSTVEGPNVVAPNNLTKLNSIIKDAMFKNDVRVIGIEGIETIITNTDFKRTLSFIQRLRDAAAKTQGIVLISMDLKTLDERERALLEKEVSGKIPVR